ncbi:MAG: YtxH domain-containing protein [Sporichthyaceae bacterium]|nr:YtxH domain-containing protein [Sporichthyaceae bacterium]
MRKFGFLAGAALGYVLGAKAGRERYEQIKDKASKVANHPTVQQAKNEAQDQATRLYGSTKDKITSKIGGSDSTDDYVGELADDSWTSPSKTTTGASSGTR